MKEDQLEPGNLGRTRAAYLAEAAAWQQMLREQSTRRREDRSLPESMDDWLGVVATATCHTPGCAAQGRADTRWFPENANGVQGACFHCEQPTRITALFDGETEEVELPNAFRAPAAQAPADPGGESEQDDPDDRLEVLGGR